MYNEAPLSQHQIAIPVEVAIAFITDSMEDNCNSDTHEYEGNSYRYVTTVATAKKDGENWEDWVVRHQIIIRRESDGKFFSTSYVISDYEPEFENYDSDDNLIFDECKPVKTTIVEFENVVTDYKVIGSE